MSYDELDDGNPDFAIFFYITSELFTHSHHRDSEDRPACSEISRQDLWSTVHSAQYTSPLPSLEGVLTMAFC